MLITLGVTIRRKYYLKPDTLHRQIEIMVEWTKSCMFSARVGRDNIRQLQCEGDTTTVSKKSIIHIMGNGHWNHVNQSNHAL